MASLLERAIVLDPTDPGPHSFLADVRVQQGRSADALALARALWGDGKAAEAVAAAQAGMDVARSAQDRERARRTLDFFGRASVAAAAVTPEQADRSTGPADLLVDSRR